MSAITIGSPLDPATEMGPLASRAAYDKTLRYIAIGREEGAVVLTGGGRPAGLANEPGLFISPTLFGGVRPEMTIAREEVFGPVLCALTWTDEEEAVKIANAVPYGLTGSIWTNDLGRAHRVASALSAGYVSVNGMAALPPSAPFGGWNASGHGVEGGRWGIEEFLRLKNVHVSLR